MKLEIRISQLYKGDPDAHADSKFGVYRDKWQCKALGATQQEAWDNYVKLYEEPR